MPKINKTDIFIIVFVIFLAVICVFISILGFGGNKKSTDTVEIYADNRLYGTYSLSKPQFVEVKKGEMHLCTVSITNEGVCMHYSCCKNQICVKSGLLTKEKALSSDISSWIVCLPNSVTVHLNTGD